MPMTMPNLSDRLYWREKPRGRAPAMYQQWRDLLFLHWRVEPEMIQRTLPPGLFVDTFEGSAFLGLVPFFMREIRPRFVPAFPPISNFLETNVRTYVHDANGTPGVWFYSLDASQPLAVLIARAFFKLPYFHARMSAQRHPAGGIHYTTQRRGLDTPPSVFHYQGSDRPHLAEPDTLTFFLVERYILFANPPSGLHTGQVHHVPYPVQPANVTRWDGSLLALAGFPNLRRPPDSALYSPGVDVNVYALQK